ncbi:flagellar basal body rod protein FlgC [Desulfoluna spongiiphila]|uniref:Flagellar basal-body rod protein FlgC n=1 Tax=Desulfoluna spongiiphila TaxID=419481 RepID=A0A1G5IXF8_9BACT|nr:flagellar basal body rod protein FlgC [Desulfoluna spongiiphila]SCY80707.1 flagellar basal-body rod protein FlgC [Desulfoluna spongiiphila]VVS93264.1 flagellar basal-body rod protein flgc [Desulfoluna spongiiphila]
MDLLGAIKVSSSALTAHRTKMNVVAENIANSETTRTAEGGPYRRKMVVFEKQEPESFDNMLKQEMARGDAVKVTEIVSSPEDFRLEYNPEHPDADPETGYVKMPNVDVLSEVADMMVARRSYDASATAVENSKNMIMKALEIGR